MTTQRKHRTINPYHRTYDGWWYACSKRFLPLFGTDRIKLVKGPKDRATEQAAVVELNQILQQIEAESLQEDMTLGVLADKYLDWLEDEVSERHFKIVKPVVCDFLEYYGNLTVKEFSDGSHDKMDKWLKSNSPKGKGKFNWSANDTRYKACAPIKAMFNYGIARLKLNRANLTIFSYETPEREARVTYFTEEQEAAVLEALKLPRFRDHGEFADFFVACIELGGRTFAETAAFTGDKIEWEAGQPICFDMGIVKKKNRYIYLSHGCRMW